MCKTNNSKSQGVNISKRLANPSFFQHPDNQIINKLKKLLRNYRRSNTIPKADIEDLIWEIEDERNRTKGNN